MFVLETKLRGNTTQFVLLDEAIRTAQFIRNKCVGYWLDNQGVGQYDLSKLCAVLAKEFEWAGKLNSMARQASAERAWSAIKRFYDNCKAKKPGKKGFPKFKKNCRSVEYKTTGWKLSEDRKHLTFTVRVSGTESFGFKAGTFLLMGADDLHFYQTSQIKRIRVVRKADGYYAQFCLKVDRQETIQPTGKAIGIDLGLKYFYKATDGTEVENPKFLRKSERKLKRLQRRVSRKQKGSKNRSKAINRLGRQHLKVSRQRKDWAVKQARALVLSSDFIAYENLQVRNMVRNHHLAKSISDAAWGLFVDWVKYYAQVFGKVQQPVPPQNTTIDCFDCKRPVQKTLSTRTHVCPYCGSVRCRDENAAWNILEKGLRLAGINTVGHTEINASGQNDLYLNPAMGLDKSAG